MITISDLQRIAPILNVAALSELAFGESEHDRITRNLRNKLKFNRELTVQESIAISKVLTGMGVVIEHRE